MWRSEDVDASYHLILETEDRPDSSQISRAFAADRVARGRALLREKADDETGVADALLKPQFLAFLLVAAALLAYPYALPYLPLPR